MSADESKYENLRSVQKNIAAEIKKAGGKIALVSGGGIARLWLRTPDTHKKEIKKKITGLIADMILQVYKSEYLTSNFKFRTTNDINMQAFVKALVVFDWDIDKQIIVRMLMDMDSVVLDAFVSFRLGVLKTKWNDLVSLANDNIAYLMSTDTFIELLKYLISNLDFRTNEVNVFCFNRTYILKDSKGAPIKEGHGDIKDCNDAFLITSLIALSPQKIRLHIDNFDGNVINLLFNLFNDRIVIC